MAGQIDQRAPLNTFLKRLWAFSARLDVTAGILFLLVLLSIVGSSIPQLAPEISTDPERFTAWVAALRAKYDGWADFLVNSGAVQFFRTWVFLLPWGLLFLFTILCVAHRWRAIWHNVTGSPMRCTPAIADGATYSASISGARGPAWEALRRALEQDGYRVLTETNEAGWFLYADRHRLARLATLVTHLGVIVLLAGVLLSTQTSWREELIVPLDGSTVVRQVGLHVHGAGFEILRYPDGNVASYEALVRVQEAQARIRVNEPLVYQSIGFHLSGYVQTRDQTAVVLQVVYDPGYALIIIAGFLVLIGMMVTFNMPFSCIRACLTEDGVLHLGGWADRRAYGFAHAFESFVQQAVAVLNTQPDTV